VCVHEQARPLCTKAMEDGIFEGLVDPRLEGNYDRKEMAGMVACAAFSIRHSAKKRPKMSQVTNNGLLFTFISLSSCFNH